MYIPNEQTSAQPGTAHYARGGEGAPGPARTNDPERATADSREVITREFAQKGLAGARIDDGQAPSVFNLANRYTFSLIHNLDLADNATLFARRNSVVETLLPFVRPSTLRPRSTQADLPCPGGVVTQGFHSR